MVSCEKRILRTLTVLSSTRFPHYPHSRNNTSLSHWQAGSLRPGKTM